MPADSAGPKMNEPDVFELAMAHGVVRRQEDAPANGPASNSETPHSQLKTGATHLDGRVPVVRATPGTAPATPSNYPFLLPPVEDDEIGRLGNYRVLRLLGKGGMAFVFLAEDIALKRAVALKVMKPDLDSDPSSWQRFLREARTLAAIKHEHLVTVFQVGKEGSSVYLAMEALEGQTVEDWIVTAGPAKVPDLLRIGQQIAAGLDAIHQNGVVHRDIKPCNLWLEKPRKHVKILDFGLARPLDDDANFTQSGIIVGTPAFMSPEQARGERIDARSDIFSLGGVLYFMCTGVRPFVAQNTIAVLTALALYDPPPIQDLNPALPKALANLIMRMLDKDPERRPPSARAVITELRKIERKPVDDAATDVLDFSELEAAADTNSKTELVRRTKGASRHSVKWSLALGLLFACLGVAGIAVIASLAGSSPTGTAATGQSKDGAQSVPQNREKKGPSAPAPVIAKPKIVFLSDLKPIEIKDWIKQPPGPPPPPPKFDGPPFEPPPREVEGVQVNGKVSPHGIFMHGPLGPEGGTARISYSLGKQYDFFLADISLNDGPRRSDTPLRFSVYGDGKALWRAPRGVRTQDDAQSCNVSIKNVDVLTIEVDCPGEPHGAHAVWIEPRVVK